MRHRRLAIVSALAAVIGVPATAHAVDNGTVTAQQFIPQNGGGRETAPGNRLAIGGSRQVLIRGLVDLDGLTKGNYLDGNSNLSDHRGYGLIRAELGAKVKMDEKVSATVTVAYYDEAGNSVPAASATSTARADRSRAVIDDAFVELKEFLGFEQLGILAGRQPMTWNLRKGHGAFLYDSRADDPEVTSWDGVRVGYAGFEGIDISPYAFRLPDNSSLFGGAIDWRPAGAGDNRTFITASANLERNVVLRATPANGGVQGLGERLITYHVGSEFELGEVDLFGEFAIQKGTERGGVQFAGWGGSAGFDWKMYQQFGIGAQVDYLTGDNDPTDGKNRAFINNWESTSDTLIVESEKYGELSRYLQGNLQALKLKAGFAFDEQNKVRLNAIYGFYRMTKPVGTVGSKSFGQELDLGLTWQYTYNATFNLRSGLFKPGQGFTAVAPAVPNASTDLAYLLDVNLTVVF